MYYPVLSRIHLLKQMSDFNYTFEVWLSGPNSILLEMAIEIYTQKWICTIYISDHPPLLTLELPH